MLKKYLVGLEKIRTARGLSKGQMAEMMGVTSSAYSSYFAESENHAFPSFPTICHLFEQITPSEQICLFTGHLPELAGLDRPLDDLEKELCFTVLSLSLNQKKTLLDMVKSLVKTGKERKNLSQVSQIPDKNGPISKFK